MSGSPRRFPAALVASVAVLLPAGLTWACVGVVSLTHSSSTVQPGGTLKVTGREFAQDVPVQIHLDSPTGPVLTTVPPPDSTMTSSFTVDVQIPSDISPGRHLLLATQAHHDMNSGQPARSVFYVGTSPPTPASAAPRPVGLDAESGPSTASLILIALGVAAVGLLVAGLWALVSSRRGGGAQAQAVQA